MADREERDAGGAQRGVDARLGVDVDGGGRLVEDGEGGAVDEDAREAEELALAGREQLGAPGAVDLVGAAEDVEEVGEADDAERAAEDGVVDRRRAERVGELLAERRDGEDARRLRHEDARPPAWSAALTPSPPTSPPASASTAPAPSRRGTQRTTPSATGHSPAITRSNDDLPTPEPPVSSSAPPRSSRNERFERSGRAALAPPPPVSAAAGTDTASASTSSTVGGGARGDGGPSPPPPPPPRVGAVGVEEDALAAGELGGGALEDLGVGGVEGAGEGGDAAGVPRELHRLRRAVDDLGEAVDERDREAGAARDDLHDVVRRESVVHPGADRGGDREVVDDGAHVVGRVQRDVERELPQDQPPPPPQQRAPRAVERLVVRGGAAGERGGLGALESVDVRAAEVALRRLDGGDEAGDRRGDELGDERRGTRRIRR